MNLSHCCGGCMPPCAVCPCPPACPTPEGPTVGTIIPYSLAYMYLASDDPEIFLDNEFFIMPVSGTLERLILSFEAYDYFIDPLAVGILEYRVFTAPLGSNVQTLVASGQFSPDITSTTPVDTILVADQVLNVPVAATTRVGIALKYSTNTPEFSQLYGTLYGGLHIV